jgi:hypothetical protein
MWGRRLCVCLRENVVTKCRSCLRLLFCSSGVRDERPRLVYEGDPSGQASSYSLGVHRLGNRQFVVSVPEVLDEGVPSHDHAGAVLLAPRISCRRAFSRP